MNLASVVAALASVGVRVSGSTPTSSVQVDSSRACPTGLAGPEPSGTINDPGQHFQTRRDRYAKVMGGLAPERDREVLLSKLGAYEEKLVSQEIERQFGEYWCKVSGLPVGVDTPAVARLVRSLHRESEIPVHKVIKRVELNIHNVMIKVPTRWQRDLLISLLNGKATNKGSTIMAVEWIYTFEAAAIFHEMEKILKKDLDRRTALEAQNLAVNAIHQSPQHQAHGPYYSRFGSQRPSYRSSGYSPKGETAKGGKKGGKGGKPALGANVHGKRGAPKGEKGGADKGRGKGYRPTYGKLQGKGSGKGQPKGGRPGYAPGRGTKGAKGAFWRGVRGFEAYPANASEWDEYYGDEGQYDRDGAADWDETDEIKVCAVRLLMWFTGSGMMIGMMCMNTNQPGTTGSMMTTGIRLMRPGRWLRCKLKCRNPYGQDPALH